MAAVHICASCHQLSLTIAVPVQLVCDDWLIIKRVLTVRHVHNLASCFACCCGLFICLILLPDTTERKSNEILFVSETLTVLLWKLVRYIFRVAISFVFV